jgi:hypothetical protein
MAPVAPSLVPPEAPPLLAPSAPPLASPTAPSLLAPSAPPLASVPGGGSGTEECCETTLRGACLRSKLFGTKRRQGGTNRPIPAQPGGPELSDSHRFLPSASARESPVMRIIRNSSPAVRSVITVVHPVTFLHPSSSTFRISHQRIKGTVVHHKRRVL